MTRTDGKRLTKAQRAQLYDLATKKMPASWLREGWPGFPQRCTDGRVIMALHAKGYVECGTHYPPPPFQSGGIWWRITDSGRLALTEGKNDE